ncbi:predicted protein [Histoplasma mississippiense (nom. inval.)]|uniref:predicted protein n=1 Tax=Ajellomyces capsulatus (strain NAm1 / WU24) TaxID=2059318 RepID=UPI000157B3BF|nr:predicted protein [Histoplasma mississippiense (nom. inval.)]EDN03202.1 predicted protein [Histoplasma mississippiense (nom. inval.)]
MWNTNIARTPSVRSLSARSMSVDSRGSGGYDSDRSSETIGNEETQVGLWQRQDRLSLKLESASIQAAELQEPRNLIVQSTQYHPKPLKQTLSEDPKQSAGEPDEVEFPQKTPTPRDHRSEGDSDSTAPEDEELPPRIPGPLEKQLSSLMSKIIFIEQGNPTISVSQEEYEALGERVKILEAEKAATAKRHEAIFAIRDDDVANLRKVRVLLAEERREHAALRKLRDDDLHNVIVLRGKLCEAIRQLTPPRRPKSSISFERRDTSDLFQAAKNAALEQRTLELEKANEDLMGQLVAATQNTAFRATTDKAWRTAVDELESKLRQKEEELAEVRRSSVASTGSITTFMFALFHTISHYFAVYPRLG